jgi:hypothetical protein
MMSTFDRGKALAGVRVPTFNGFISATSSDGAVTEYGDAVNIRSMCSPGSNTLPGADVPYTDRIIVSDGDKQLG